MSFISPRASFRHTFSRVVVVRARCRRTCPRDENAVVRGIRIRSDRLDRDRRPRRFACVNIHSMVSSRFFVDVYARAVDD